MGKSVQNENYTYYLYHRKPNTDRTESKERQVIDFVAYKNSVHNNLERPQ